MSESFGPDDFQIPVTLIEGFALLRRPRNAQDLGWELGTRVTDRYGLLASETRRTITPSGREAWVTPGTKGAAFTIASGPGAWGTGFATLDSVVLRGISGYSESPSGAVTQHGLVPDGVAFVRMSFADGEPSTFAVADNTYDVDLPTVAKSVDWLDSEGQPFT